MGQSATDSLNMFESTDGIRWYLGSPSGSANYVPNGSCTPVGCVRDPSIAKFGSTWWIAHTCVGALSGPHEWCLASSSDLVTFSSATQISTNAFSSSLDVLAPEWVKNPDGTPYLTAGSCPHIAMALSDLSSSFAVYESHPTNCADFTQPWSTPVVMAVTGETTYFDPMVVCRGSGTNEACTGSGDTFYLWYSHIDLGSAQNVQYASSSTLTGTYTRLSPGGNWIGGSTNQEGPMTIKLSDRWRTYYDQVPGAVGDIQTGQISYIDSFDSWATWSAPKYINSPIQAKHGTVIPYP